METSSPEYLRTSLAAAMVLGLAPGRFYREVELHCVNLLLTYPQGCAASCAYCGLARKRPGAYAEKSFIRVPWPVVSTAEVVERLVRYRPAVERVCLSMVAHPRAYEDTIAVLGWLRERTDVLLSALIAPIYFTLPRLEQLRQMGVDMLGIGLDAASQRVFRRTRHPLPWDKYWQVIVSSREVFGPFRVNVHLVVGIGETDREMVEVFQRLLSMEVLPYLFSFYPEEGSAMARRRQPSLVRFRRLQLVRHLMAQGVLTPQHITFDERGRICRLHLPAPVLETALFSGEPFLTNGCPDRAGEVVCTRPYGSYRPGKAFRDYPFPPSQRDLAEIRRQLRLGEIAEFDGVASAVG